jgi:hypothetical protein
MIIAIQKRDETMNVEMSCALFSGLPMALPNPSAIAVRTELSMTMPKTDPIADPIACSINLTVFADNSYSAS